MTKIYKKNGFFLTFSILKSIAIHVCVCFIVKYLKICQIKYPNYDSVVSRNE